MTSRKCFASTTSDIGVHRADRIGYCVVMVFLGGIFAACMAVISIFEPIHAVYIPAPSDAHPYKVAIAEFPLTVSPRRDLEMSLFMPVANANCITQCDKIYMPDEVAKASDAQFFRNASSSVFTKMKHKECCKSDKAIDASKLPLVFMEPQVGISRFLYSMLARYMSANGMAVAVIDHNTGGSRDLDPFSELQEWDESVTKEIDTRRDDIDFVLEKLNDISFLRRQFRSLSFNGSLDTGSFSIVGHGIGGTTATSLGMEDGRVRFSINLSGSAPSTEEDKQATVYFFGRSEFTRDDDINWPETWKHLVGKATEWDFKDAGLFDYSDLPWIADLARKNENVTIQEVKGLRDSLGPWGFHVTACYLEAYLKSELTDARGDIEKCYHQFDQMQPYSGNQN
ncbi:hypothetical protein E8E13_003392 [Curvularia kusanoi]|uniref:1-alkyl-2-acetylglycerophosphocholine esterase n=1 Tax=Curvularia kusanoi TaxID=90978 RepID=A0A9P4W4C3_CURKU|nr:hypothetical protein E8E13_003392 [Curvularia kusanoi]